LWVVGNSNVGGGGEQQRCGRWGKATLWVVGNSNVVGGGEQQRSFSPEASL